MLLGRSASSAVLAGRAKQAKPDYGSSIFIGGDLVAKLSCKIRREMGNFSLVSSVGGAAQCCRGTVLGETRKTLVLPIFHPKDFKEFKTLVLLFERGHPASHSPFAVN